MTYWTVVLIGIGMLPVPARTNALIDKPHSVKVVHELVSQPSAGDQSGEDSQTNYAVRQIVELDSR